MSLYGNDCHFFYNSVCMKGSSCPFRHCEAAKKSNVTCQFWKQNKCTKPSCSFRHADIAVTKNRAEIPCYWETQPSGCAKFDCPFKHINSKGGKNTEQNSGSVDEAAGDVEGNAQQSFVVNLAEDSDIEMASPEKKLHKVIGTTETKNENKQGSVTSAVIVKKQPAATTLKKREPSVEHAKRLIVHPSVSQKQTVAAKVLTSNKIPTHPVTSQKLHVEAKKQTSNKVSIKNRLTLKSSENEMEEPVKKIPVKERLKLGSTEEKKSVKERLYVKNEAESRVSKNEETLGSDGDEEDDSDGEVEVKSLEQIQREKALRSMGLIELKNGKLIKISELEKSKGTEDKGESDEESEEEGGEKQEEEEQDHEEEEEQDEEEEDEEDVESSKEEESSNEQEEEEVEEEEFVDPEIELSAPDDEFEEEIENTRLTVKKVLVKSDTRKKRSQVVEDKHVKGRRIIVAGDEGGNNDTPDLKAALRKRLGRRVQSIENSAGEKPQEPAIKRRLGMIGSSNEGTIKTVKGIKSRLGYKAEQQEEEHTIGDAREKLKLKKKHEIQKRDSDGEETGGVVRVITGSEEKPVKKRGWRKTKIIIQRVEDSSDSESSTADTPELSVQTESLKSKVSPQKTSVSPQKSTVPETKRIRKEEDSGTKLQNMFTQKWRNTIWSNRNQKAKSVNNRLDELGIGIIDIKGGKVVKMGAKDEDKKSKQKQEDKLVNHFISHETKKEPKKNQKIYVPPAMKRQTVDDPDTENGMTAKKRGRITYTEEKSDSEEDSSSDVHVKTFAEIMSAKQKQKKSKSTAEETKLEEPDVTHVQDLSEESNEVPSESAVYNIAKMITGSLNKVANKTSDSQSSKHHKKKSRWRKKRKSSHEKGEKSLKQKHSSETVLETSNLETESNQQTTDTIGVSQAEVFCTAPEISQPAADQSQKEIQSPKKRSDQLLSDSWLDLVDDEDGSGVATQDDDDLLREIDELLA